LQQQSTGITKYLNKDQRPLKRTVFGRAVESRDEDDGRTIHTDDVASSSFEEGKFIRISSLFTNAT